MAERPRYTMTIRVPASDIDELQHVNNIAYLRYVQDVAIAHWVAMASPELKQSVVWVVRKHEIEYFRPAFVDDELTIATWVGEPSAATWERFTEIIRASDGQKLVQARTVWVLIDPKTRRPKRVDQTITANFMTHNGE